MSFGVQRFTFGIVDLVDGNSFLLVAMATFAIGEALVNVPGGEGERRKDEAQELRKVKNLRLEERELKQIAPAMGHSSVLGFLVGVLPGTGAAIAGFLAYGMERSLANPKEQKKFGKGSLVGLAAPEVANNAASSGAFVPLLTLGIPCSGTTAVMLGIQSCPRLYLDNPEIFWSVIVSMHIGNVVLLILNLPLVPYLALLLSIPRQFLLPLLLSFSLIGVYLISFNVFEILLMTIIAALALFLRLLDFPMPPLLPGFVLGG